jgi:hypothetical protein
MLSVRPVFHLFNRYAAIMAAPSVAQPKTYENIKDGVNDLVHSRDYRSKEKANALAEQLKIQFPDQVVIIDNALNQSLDGLFWTNRFRRIKEHLNRNYGPDAVQAFTTMSQAAMNGQDYTAQKDAFLQAYQDVSGRKWTPSKDVEQMEGFVTRMRARADEIGRLLQTSSQAAPEASEQAAAKSEPLLPQEDIDAAIAQETEPVQEPGEPDIDDSSVGGTAIGDTAVGDVPVDEDSFAPDFQRTLDNLRNETDIEQFTASYLRARNRWRKRPDETQALQQVRAERASALGSTEQSLTRDIHGRAGKVRDFAARLKQMESVQNRNPQAADRIRTDLWYAMSGEKDPTVKEFMQKHWQRAMKAFDTGSEQVTQQEQQASPDAPADLSVPGVTDVKPIWWKNPVEWFRDWSAQTQPQMPYADQWPEEKNKRRQEWQSLPPAQRTQEKYQELFASRKGAKKEAIVTPMSTSAATILGASNLQNHMTRLAGTPEK